MHPLQNEYSLERTAVVSRPSVLIVDDEPDLLTLLEMTLARMDIQAVTASSLAAARETLEAATPALCLTDLRLPDGNGLNLIAEIQQRYPSVPVAMMTAHGSTESAVEALKLGAFDFVSKPVPLDRLRELVNHALKLSTMPDAQTDDTLIGETPIIATLKRDIQRVARSQAPVHVHGESGVGKEVVARLVHQLGPRSAAPFLAINCGAIPSELVESELFGHKRGAFTGATSDKPGLFQAASGGTLLLDEIADLPLSVQVKLLRAIQEKAVRPLGVEKEVPVDVRLITATHKNLAEEVREGRFRDDLYYRINVIDLFIPPLRHRRADIPLIARHILLKMADGTNGKPLSLSNDAIELLKQHEFRGNIRARAATLLDGDRIERHNLDLSPGPRQTAPQDAALIPEISQAPPAQEHHHLGDLDSYPARVEREILEDTLQRHRWNRAATAKALGINLRSLRYRVKKLDIEV